MKFSKGIVFLSIVTLIAYTAVVLYFVWHGRHVPDSLTYAFFGAFAVELSALAGIKIKETIADNTIPAHQHRYEPDTFESVFPKNDIL